MSVTITEETPIVGERGSHSGPQAGGYISLPFTIGEVMVADAVFVWKVPFPCKIVHVSADCVSTTGGTWSLDTTTGNVVADRTIPTAVEDVHAGADADLDIDAVAAANRSLAEGESMTVTFNVGTNILSGCIVVTLRITGQPTEWDAIDD